MEPNEAYRIAERKIEEARQSGAKELDLRPKLDAKGSEKLAELPGSLSRLTQLQSLDLSYNVLTALPDWLGRLEQLQTLDLHINNLSTLPESLSDLAQLRSLNLSRNQLTALPESLGRLTQLHSLSVSGNQLATLPESLGQLSQLQSLDLASNRLNALPEWLVRLTPLRRLNASDNQLVTLQESLGEAMLLRTLVLSHNKLTSLPETLRRLTQLQALVLSSNWLRVLPEWFGQLTRLRSLYARDNYLASLPESLGELAQLLTLDVSGNRLTDLPVSLVQLEHLEIKLRDNPLNPELAAADQEGLGAVKRYMRAKAEAQVVLNEAKLILIGEGEVGKSCLLGALRGDPWEEGRPTTHGIEIKPVKLSDPGSGTEITLNGWDFGGQRVYRPTHQLFFSAPAVYLVVWKPREGPQQGLVKEWIKLVKHREPDAKILVVATHGGPKERQPDIDRQEIWDLFGKETVVDFYFVESKPNEQTGDREGIGKLREAIARAAAGLPEVGRSVPKSWVETRTALEETGAAYLPLEKVLELCSEHNMTADESNDFIRVSHRLGHLIHYAHDPALRDIVVLKPDWLATAMSYVLDDKQTRDNHGLVEFARLGEVWNDPERPAESRYDASLHPLFLRLMERFDLSYKVAVPAEPEDALGFWQRVGRSLGTAKKPPADVHYTTLIAQLVPDVRPPQCELNAVWPSDYADGDCQQVQICRIVETKNGQSANAEGLFYQLIVRLNKYSLGRANFKESVHWQRGLVLDDDYNGRALLEHTGNDVRISVRAPYPEAFLAVLTHEVKWLVESFWEGLRCDVMVPCVEPCGREAPGTGLYEVQKLIESKRKGKPEYPCPVCSEWQDIDCLLRNSPAARPAALDGLMGEFVTVKAELAGVRQQLITFQGAAMGRFDNLDIGTQRILSRVDDAFAGLMHALTDEAKEGPRLFSFEPVDRSRFDPTGWVRKRFRLTLWCEHSRLPLPMLNQDKPKLGVYEFEVPRDWFVKAAPTLKLISATLSLVLPVASSAMKLALTDDEYKFVGEQLDFGKTCAEAMIKAGDKSLLSLGEIGGPELERGGTAGSIGAQGQVLRQLHAWLKEHDKTLAYGGLVRVQNKRQEFLWVHPRFEKEY